jgi:geranylgeranyl diphosphate synthase, type II
MDHDARIEQALEMALARATGVGAPTLLSAALHHSVFPGGARLRPRLTLAVAAACGEDDPVLSDVAAAAIELLHCASLVHDDLPCFDDATERRGKPSVHKAFGEPLAVLAGDGLIVLAFEELSRILLRNPVRVAGILGAVCRGVGTPHGIVAGQALECEPTIEMAAYHQAKTGALLEAAAAVGAMAAGVDHRPWSRLGARLGEAYQVADDIRDVMSAPEAIGKPVGRDAALGRPNAVKELGIRGAAQRVEQLIADGLAAIPEGPGRDAISAMVLGQLSRFTPHAVQQAAA